MREEYTIECSGQTVLECASCKERMVLIGHIEDWYSANQLQFPCACGRVLSFADGSPPAEWLQGKKRFQKLRK